MSPEIAEIKRRLFDALDEPERAEDWLPYLEHKLRMHANRTRCLKLYDISTVGQRIQTAREVLGMSRRQLGLRLDVSPLVIMRWEKGVTPLPARKLPGLCACLGVHPRWLLMEQEDGGPPLPREVIRRPLDESWAKRTNRWKRKGGAEKAAALRALAAGIKATADTLAPTDTSGTTDTKGVSDDLRFGR